MIASVRIIIFAILIIGGSIIFISINTISTTSASCYEASNQSNAFVSNINRLKSNLSAHEFNILEFGTTENSLPLYPVYNNRTDSIWVGDTFPGSSRLFEFDLSTKNYTVHDIADLNLVTFTAIDLHNPNLIWFVDPTQNIIGQFDAVSGQVKRYENPVEGVISGLTLDKYNNIWMTLIHANKILKFNSGKESFVEFSIPTENSVPLGIVYDEIRDYIWFAESTGGKIGQLDLDTGEIKEYSYSNSATNNSIVSDIKINESQVEPTSVVLNRFDCNIYISDHKRNSVFSFDPDQEKFREYPLNNKKGLAFGMVVDKNGFLWIAEHIVDFLSVIDPETGENVQIKIPSGSYVQYLTSDGDGNIWFAQQGYDGLGIVIETMSGGF